VTAAGAGVAGILPERAGAHTIHKHHHRPFLPTKKSNDNTALKNSFCAVVAAFNNGTASSSPQLFDPHVIMISVKQHHEYKGWQPADSGSYNNISVQTALQGLVGAQFVPLQGQVTYDANTGLVHGPAYWHDNDGSPDDKIQFKFYFNSSGIVTKMQATPGSGYNGPIPPPSDCP
jgi:hypothetical protein